jgi:hypothetical protein
LLLIQIWLVISNVHRYWSLTLFVLRSQSWGGGGDISRSLLGGKTW